MSVTVERSVHRVALERLLETTAAEKRIDLLRLARDGLADRCVVEKRDAAWSPEARERGLELQRLAERLLHEVLDHGLTPRAERAASESAAEALHPCEADVLEHPAVAVEDLHAGVAEDLRDLFVLPRLVVVVSENGEHRHLHHGELFGENVRFFGKAVVGEITAEEEQIGASLELREERSQMAGEVLGAVEIADRSDTDRSRLAHGLARSQNHTRPDRDRWGAGPRLEGETRTVMLTNPTKSSRSRRTPLSTRRMVSLPASLFYGDTLRTLTEAKVPFVVGGAFALKHYAGVERGTKDLDVFLCRRDLPQALEALQERGYTTDETFPHWLSKAWCGDHFVDFIHASANGLCQVDEAWITSAVTITIFDQPALLCPIEEMIWSKCFVMERERFDGADINHLLAARGDKLDWKRLLARFGAHWRILLGHLVFFSFAYPKHRDKVPAWVMEDLTRQLHEEREAEDVPVCNGTLLSREQYLVDIRDHGYQDARVPPHGSVPQDDIDAWTDAIGKIQ